MGGRAVEGTGLENRQGCKLFVGSNPTPSARSRQKKPLSRTASDTSLDRGFLYGARGNGWPGALQAYGIVYLLISSPSGFTLQVPRDRAIDKLLEIYTSELQAKSGLNGFFFFFIASRTPCNRMIASNQFLALILVQDTIRIING
jgi:hypothetical protein